MRNYVLTNARLAVAISAALSTMCSVACGAEYPWGDGEVPGDLIENAAKVYFYVDHELGPGTGWDDLNVLILPMYNLDGGVHGYYAIITPGDYGPVSFDGLMDLSRRYYEINEEIRSVAAANADGAFDYKIAELERERLTTTGGSLDSDTYTFWFTLFYVKKRGVSYYLSGGALPHAVILLYQTKVNLENRFGVSDLEFVRFVATGRGHLAEFAGEGKRYFGPTAFHSGVFCDEADIPALREGYKPKDADSEPGRTWEFIFEEMENLKRGVRTDRMNRE